MLKINFITVGSLSESHWRSACDEYKKRLSAAAKVNEIQLKEAKISKDPSPSEIGAALEAEADRILDEIPPRSCVFALCIEGKQYSSTELASMIDTKMSEGIGDLCFIIGSSHGLSERVKKRSDVRLSMSKLTFPHQLARVMLYEAVYRCLEINKGSKYHK